MDSSPHSKGWQDHIWEGILRPLQLCLPVFHFHREQPPQSLVLISHHIHLVSTYKYSNPFRPKRKHHKEKKPWGGNSGLNMGASGIEVFLNNCNLHNNTYKPFSSSNYNTRKETQKMHNSRPESSYSASSRMRLSQNQSSGLQQSKQITWERNRSNAELQTQKRKPNSLF